MARGRCAHLDGRETQNRSLRLATAVLSNTAAQTPDSVYLPIRTSAAGISSARTTIEKIYLTEDSNMSTASEIVLPKKTSVITFGVNDPVIPKGTYRAAIGFKFEADIEQGFIEYLVCQTLVALQEWLLEGSDMEFGSFAGSVFFRTDSKSGITSAIVLWKDHRCFDLDIGGSRYMISETLSELVWNSPYEKELLSAQRFVVRAKKQLTRNMIKNFEKFLSGGEYVGRTNLLS
jgi:hypothetical protein